MGHQMLEPAGFVFQASQPLRLTHFESAVFTFPGIDCGFADTVLTRQVRATLRPASCYFRVPMICSSLNRPFFIVGSSFVVYRRR